MAGQTLRADCAGGALASDVGPLLLRGIDRQIGRTEHLAAAVHDQRPPSSIDYPLRELCAQRLDQSASGYADGNAAKRLRRDPLGQLGVERLPLEATQDLARAPAFSRLEHHVDRQDLSRLTTAFVDHFRASDTEPPAAIVLALDHADDRTPGQQAFAFYNSYYKSSYALPLFSFEGTAPALGTASRRPGARPTGAEHARILARLLPDLRQRWPYPPSLVRGDSHVAPPEGMDVIAPRRLTDGVFGFAGNPVLLRHAEPLLQDARHRHQQRTALAPASGQRLPARSRRYEELC